MILVCKLCNFASEQAAAFVVVFTPGHPGHGHIYCRLCVKLNSPDTYQDLQRFEERRADARRAA